MPIVAAQTRKSSYEEVNSLDFSNSRFRPLTFFIFAHVMSDVACDIEASERQRARALAVVMLQPARLIGKRSARGARPSECLSCLRDSLLTYARRARLSSLVGDLSVVRRDVVRAGFTGSRRARCNFHVVERILLRIMPMFWLFMGGMTTLCNIPWVTFLATALETCFGM